MNCKPLAEVSDAEGALTEILAIHRPVDYSDEYSDEPYLLCGGCASAHPEPMTSRTRARQPAPSSTVSAMRR